MKGPCGAPRQRWVPLRPRGEAGWPRMALGTLLVLGVLAVAACQDTQAVFPGPALPREQATQGSSASRGQAPPNLLLITIDTLRADALGAYGNPRVKTPNMDALAREGALFAMAIAPVPQTNPSHASIFTGVFPDRHGVQHHMVTKLSSEAKPLAQVLAEAGYTTAGHYSWISFDPEYSGLERGFATYQRHTVDRPWPEDRKPDWYEEYMDGRADVTTEGVLAWLGGGVRDPFFLWVHYMDPHFPFDPPPPFETMYGQCRECPDGSMETIKSIIEGRSFADREVAHLRALYDGEVSYTDQQLGRVFAWLRERGLMDRTVIALMADHGESFGENGLWFHPEVLYNTAIRIPLLLRYPPKVPVKVVEAPASAVDVMPTLLDILGIPVPQGIEGKSLVPLILGRESGQERAAFSQLWDGRQIAIVYGGRKLLKDRVTGRLELYDLGQDRRELTNLAEAQPGRAKELEQRLDAWAAAHRLGP